MGLLLLGLWGMLALLLGASIGKETHYHAGWKADLEPGFGETHATRPHLLDKVADAARHEGLFSPCLSADCFGREDVVAPGYRDEPVDDGADDATSSLGGPRNPGGTPGSPLSNISPGSAPFANGLFLPGPGGNPNPGGPGNPNSGNPADPDSPNTNPNDTPPPDFNQPPFFNPPGPDGPTPHDPGPNDTGPEGPRGPDGPPDGGKPIQIPEPLTLSLFATGVAGSVLLRRRKARPPK